MAEASRSAADVARPLIEAPRPVVESPTSATIKPRTESSERSRPAPESRPRSRTFESLIAGAEEVPLPELAPPPSLSRSRAPSVPRPEARSAGSPGRIASTESERHPGRSVAARSTAPDRPAAPVRATPPPHAASSARSARSAPPVEPVSPGPTRRAVPPTARTATRPSRDEGWLPVQSGRSSVKDDSVKDGSLQVNAELLSQVEVAPIRINALSKQFDTNWAVRDLSFTAAPGRVTGLLGPTGAGKTTTLRMLVGLTRPTAGSATFGDHVYAQLRHPQRMVGTVLGRNFHPRHSGRDHLRVAAATAGVNDDQVDDLLYLVGLADAAPRPAAAYSLGMQQRLAIAGALLGEPDYLILDEPAIGLDPEGIRWLRGFLRSFAATGRAVLISSHLLNDAQQIVDDVVVIRDGRLIDQINMAKLAGSGGTTRLRVDDISAARKALAELAETIVCSDDEGQYLRVRSHDVTEIGFRLYRSDVIVYELVREELDLEQLFFSALEGAA